MVTPGKVMRLKKGCYGLSQSGRVFYKLLIKTLKDFGLEPASEDECIFVKKRGDSILIVATVVDDMLEITNDDELLREFNAYLEKHFIITDNGPMEWFLGVNFRQHPEGGWHASQTAYVERCLRAYGVDDDPGCKTPMLKGFTVSEQDLCDNPDPEVVKLGKQMLGSLGYLTLWTRPDIAFAVNMLARHVLKATPALIEKLRKIFRYLKATKDYGIRIHAHDPLGHGAKLYTFVDASDADCKFTRRSTGGYVIYFNGTPIAWRSARQPLVTLSTAESEYVQATLACQEVLCLRRLFEQLGEPQDEPTLMYEDNKAAIDLSVNPCSRGHTKHMERRWHFVRQCNESGEIMMCKVDGTINPADTFTKALAFEPFVMYRRMLSIVPFADER